MTMAHSKSRTHYAEVLDHAVSDRRGIRKPESLAQRIRCTPVQRIDSRHRLVHWTASDAQSVHGVSCRYHYGA